ncbi:MAG: aminopeptidase P family protein [Bacteroidales bacterium]|nr:aminopeptidase P family protein [Bacteroidales bacterium]
MKETITERLAALRALMTEANVRATLIPQTDPHHSEYIADHWQVRRWLSGFTGSAGTLVVTADKALLWTDSRYFLQAAQQLEDTGIELMKDGLPDTPSINYFLTHNLQKGDVVGIDGNLFSIAETEELASTLARAGMKLNPEFDVIDRIWTDRPSLPDAPVFIHELKFAGEEASSKIGKILAGASEQGATAILISALDEIAWTLNIRSRDVNCNPVATAFLYLSPAGSTLFIKEEKLTDEIRTYLADNGVTTAPYSDLHSFLTALPADARVLVEAPRTSVAVLHTLGDRALQGSSPVPMLKAIKNDVQIAGIRAAMEHDGAALVGAFMEIERMLNTGEELTELAVSDILTRFRSQQPYYFDESFETIAGYGPHGAIVHYSATPESSSTVEPRGLLLIDSGAQYLTGTTDITRTICVGTPTDQERRDFTLVMKGHIALGTAIFPEGTCGMQLDALARQFLWKEGLSYLHGTGHGVGHFLNVHEGPQSIRLNYMPAPLTPGMLTSNEPGLYRAGIHGIRCENLVLTVPAFTTEFGRFFRFETMTLFPFDRNLFDTAIMTPQEVEWVNAYHAEVYTRLLPLLTPEQGKWLREKTLPL